MQQLLDLVESASRIAALTGAGCSTASGIPDYRGPDGRWKTHTPVLYQEFLRSESARRRYWARSFRGWKRFDAARPNESHFAFAALESRGKLAPLITQNVDRLHHAAGHRAVIELHGNNDEVVCVECRSMMARSAFQSRMESHNRHFVAEVLSILPDGDAELPEDSYRDFELLPCERCGGILKPNVVFFGENVPRARVEDAMRSVDESDLLLIAGSSLQVWSGYRFAVRAHESGKPVVIINRGETRADDLATLKVEDDCGKVLTHLGTLERA